MGVYIMLYQALTIPMELDDLTDKIIMKHIAQCNGYDSSIVDRDACIKLKKTETM